MPKNPEKFRNVCFGEFFTLTGQSCLGLLHLIVFSIPSLIVSLLRQLNFGIFTRAKLMEI